MPEPLAHRLGLVMPQRQRVDPAGQHREQRRQQQDGSPRGEPVPTAGQDQRIVVRAGMTGEHEISRFLKTGLGAQGLGESLANAVGG